MKKLIFIVLILVANNLFAQNEENKIIDSLKIELRKAKIDTVKINILNEICRLNFYNDPMIGMGYSEIALNLSTKIKWKKGMAVAYNHIGICNWVTKKPQNSIDCFQNSLVYYKELKDQKNISDNYNRLGILYGETGKDSLALTYFNMAYQINVKIGNILQTANDLSGMGDIYNKMGKHEKALDYYLKAHQNYKDVLNIFGMGLTNFNMGKIYVIQEKHFKALEYYNKALDRFTESKSLYYIADTYLEIVKAKYNYTYENKKEKIKNLKLAIKSLKEAIRIFTNYKAFHKVNECYIELSKTYEEIGDYKLALDSYKNYVKIDQTFLNYDKENQLSELKIKRKIETKNNQIQIQQSKIKDDIRKVYLLVVITGSAAILLVVFLWLYISKRKTNQLLVDKNEEILNINKQKDKFFSIIAHDLRGPFNGFLGLTELLAQEIDDMNKEEIQFSAINMRSSAHSMSQLLDNLLEWSIMEQGQLPFNPKKYNLLKIVKECIIVQLDAANKKDIQITTIVEDSLEVYADHHILQSTIRNIISNAVKFTPKGGRIKILAIEKDNNTIISITDNGIGMNTRILKNIFQLDIKTNRNGTEDEPSTGLGLILCKEFIEKHGGKIWVESEEKKGSSFYFSLPCSDV